MTKEKDISCDICAHPTSIKCLDFFGGSINGFGTYHQWCSPCKDFIEQRRKEAQEKIYLLEDRQYNPMQLSRDCISSLERIVYSIEKTLQRCLSKELYEHILQEICKEVRSCEKEK